MTLITFRNGPPTWCKCCLGSNNMIPGPGKTQIGETRPIKCKEVPNWGAQWNMLWTLVTEIATIHHGSGFGCSGRSIPSSGCPLKAQKDGMWLHSPKCKSRSETVRKRTTLHFPSKKERNRMFFQESHSLQHARDLISHSIMLVCYGHKMLGI